MKKTYEFDNATIHIQNINNYDREKIKKATEDFLKKVISGGTKYGNSDSSRDFREKQILY